MKVVNRKFAKRALECGKNLKGNKRYGENTRIYLNENLCPEFQFLNFAVRQAYKNSEIYKYKVRNGLTYVKMDEYGSWIDICHIQDLENNKIRVPERRKPSN